jgi:hypothetical protein
LLLLAIIPLQQQHYEIRKTMLADQLSQYLVASGLDDGKQPMKFILRELDKVAV